MPETIVIVEDDADIRELEGYALRNSSFETVELERGSELFAYLDDGKASLILLDIMLPDDDGIAVLRRLRSESGTKTLPVILVTAKGSELDRVRGLDGGADDYVVKPFGVMELVSRVKALLRRAKADKNEAVLSIHGISLDDSRHSVTSGGDEITLTLKEYELLRVLMKNTGIVLTRERLMDLVWGFDFTGESRTVDMHIKTLRKKLGAEGDHIITIRGVGYKLGEE